MSVINLDYVLKDTEGEDIKDNGNPVTARQAIRRALMVDLRDKVTDPKEMIECADLQAKLRTGSPDLTPEELVLCKKWAGLAWGKLIYSELVKVIDGKTTPLD